MKHIIQSLKEYFKSKEKREESFIFESNEIRILQEKKSLKI